VIKAMGLSNGKENVSSTLTYKKFIKQQGLVKGLQPRSKKVAINKELRKFRKSTNMNSKKRFQGKRKHINCEL